MNQDRSMIDNASTGAGYRLARFATNGEIVEPRTRDRVMSSALSAMAATAVTPLIFKLFKQKMSLPVLAGNIATNAAMGFFAPDVGNLIKKEIRGDINKEETMAQIKQIENLKKESSIFGGAARLLGTGIAASGKAIGKGLYTGKNPSFGRKAWGFAVKGTALGGAGFGAYKGLKHMQRTKSGENYTTFMRNNVLSGNIQPDQLDQDDLINVRKLGMN